MFKIAEDIQSLPDFKRNTPEFIQHVKNTGRPTVLTINGKAEVVVMDAMTYQKSQERYDYEASVQQIVQRLQEFEKRDHMPLEKSFNKLKKEFKLKNDKI
jgi:PHD/YefM family antitoxin component YafN of YafNO toxin-antitoxin module